MGDRYWQRYIKDLPPSSADNFRIFVKLNIEAQQYYSMGNTLKKFLLDIEEWCLLYSRYCEFSPKSEFVRSQRMMQFSLNWLLSLLEQRKVDFFPGFLVWSSLNFMMSQRICFLKKFYFEEIPKPNELKFFVAYFSCSWWHIFYCWIILAKAVDLLEGISFEMYSQISCNITNTEIVAFKESIYWSYLFL